MSGRRPDDFEPPRPIRVRVGCAHAAVRQIGFLRKCTTIVPLSDEAKSGMRKRKSDDDTIVTPRCASARRRAVRNGILSDPAERVDGFEKIRRAIQEVARGDESGSLPGESAGDVLSDEDGSDRKPTDRAQ